MQHLEMLMLHCAPPSMTAKAPPPPPPEGASYLCWHSSWWWWSSTLSTWRSGDDDYDDNRIAWWRWWSSMWHSSNDLSMNIDKRIRIYWHWIVTMIFQCDMKFYLFKIGNNVSVMLIYFWKTWIKMCTFDNIESCLCSFDSIPYMEAIPFVDVYFGSFKPKCADLLVIHDLCTHFTLLIAEWLNVIIFNNENLLTTRYHAVCNV